MIRLIHQGLARLLEWMLIISMGTLVFDVLWGVLSRMLGSLRAWMLRSWEFDAAFLPAGQSPWTEELARFLLIWVGMLGGALAFARGGHLGVDYFVGKLHPQARRVMASVTWLIVIFFAAAVLGHGGWLLFRQTLAMGQETPALGIPKALVYLSIPVSGAFTIVFALAHLWTILRHGPAIPAGNPHPSDSEP